MGLVRAEGLLHFDERQVVFLGNEDDVAASEVALLARKPTDEGGVGANLPVDCGKVTLIFLEDDELALDDVLGIVDIDAFDLNGSRIGECALQEGACVLSNVLAVDSFDNLAVIDAELDNLVDADLVMLHGIHGWILSTRSEAFLYNSRLLGFVKHFESIGGWR